MNMEQSRNKYLIWIFAIGILTHLFFITNVIKNHDSMYVLNGVGAGTSSGRWALELISIASTKLIGGNYNIPLFNGMITIAIISLSSYIVMKFFNIKDFRLAVILGAIFISFPSLTSAMFYSFTVHYYALAILLIVTSVYITDRFEFGFIFAIFLGAIAIGIYQAYFTLAIGLFVLKLLQISITGDKDIKQTLRKSIKYLLILCAILIIYMIALKFFIRYFDVKLTSYKGINEIGKINFSRFPALIMETYRESIGILYSGYYHTFPTIIVKACLFVLGLLSVIMLVFIVKEKKEVLVKNNKSIYLLYVIIFPLALNSIRLIVQWNNGIYTLMVYGSLIIYIVPIMIFEEFNLLDFAKKNRRKTKKVLVTMMICYSMIVFNYAYIANLNYAAQYFTNEQAKSTLNSIITTTQSKEGFSTDKKWAFVGMKNTPSNDGWVLNHKIKIGGNNLDANTFINEEYVRELFIRQYTDADILFASPEETRIISNEQWFKDMPNYPNSGSIVIKGDFIVVKLG